MTINASQLGKSILAALKNALKEKWPELREYSEAEAKKIAQTFVMIDELNNSGKITEEQARLYLDIQKNSSRTILLTLEGLGILTVEAAINIALDSVKEAVNTALGFTLL